MWHILSEEVKETTSIDVMVKAADMMSKHIQTSPSVHISQFIFQANQNAMLVSFLELCLLGACDGPQETSCRGNKSI